MRKGGKKGWGGGGRRKSDIIGGNIAQHELTLSRSFWQSVGGARTQVQKRGGNFDGRTVVCKRSNYLAKKQKIIKIGDTF